MITAKKLIAIAAMSAFLAFSLSACSAMSPASSSGDTSSAIDSSSGASSSGASSASSSSPSKPAKDLALDLADAHDRHIVNDVLCWAAQAYVGDTAYDLLSAESRAQFAVTYISINDDGAVERGEYPDVPGRGGGANGTFNARIALDAVNDVCKEYFGRKLGAASLGADSPYQSKDGYLYFGTTAPFGQTASYAAATSVERVGDGVYAVSFDVFSDGMPRIKRDDAFYGLTHDAMMAELGVGNVRAAGTATIKVVEREGGKAAVLVSYSTSPASRDSSPSQSSASAQSRQSSPSTEIDTPYYHVSIPDGWPLDLVTGITYDVDEELRHPQGGGLGIGCTTTVHIGGGDIWVTCFTDNWGPQGDFTAEVIGVPEALPGWRVIAYTVDPKIAGGNVARDLSGYLAEFATFVSLGSGGNVQPENAVQGGAMQGSTSDSAARNDAAEGFRSRLKEINAAWISDPRAGGTTQSMIEAGNDFCGRYDQLMGEVYAYVEGLPGSNVEALAASQDAWSAETDEHVRRIEAEYAGGSLVGPAILSEKMEMQRARIGQLIDMI